MRWLTLSACALAIALACTGAAQGEEKTFRRELRRLIAENQSRDDARAAATAEAKRAALEEAGTYLESLTVVRNAEVEKDDVLALAAGVTRSTVEKEEPYVEGNAFGIRVVVAVSVDTAQLDERIRKLLADRQHLEDLKRSETRVAELLERVRQLEAENARLGAGASAAEQQGLQASFRQSAQGLTAQESFQKGLALWNGRRFEPAGQAVEFFSQAIALDPNYVYAYGMRGIAYFNLRQYQFALEDFDRAIQLDPNDAKAYSGRGFAYASLGRISEACRDWRKSCELGREIACKEWLCQ